MGKITYGAGDPKDPIDAPLIERTRFAFGAQLKIQLPHPDDLIIPATARVLEAYNKQSYHRVADPLLVEALSAAPSRCYQYGTAPAVHLLVRAETFIKVQLKLKFCDACPTRAGGRPIVLSAAAAAATVLIRNGEIWLPLIDWLPTLPAQRMRNLYSAALELQRKEWVNQGKHFRFLDLPNELQDHILLLAIGEYIEPRYTSERHPDTGMITKNIVNLTGQGLEQRRVDRDWHVESLHARLKPVNPALFGLSKKYRAVALDILWKDTTKCFQSLDRFQDIPAQIPQHRLRNIRRMELALTHLQFIEMFRCQIKPFDRYTWHSTTVPALTLKRLPALEYLELFFMSTAHPSYSPWPSEYSPYGPARMWSWSSFGRSRKRKCLPWLTHSLRCSSSAAL